MERAFVKASRSRKKFMICHFGTRQMRWSRKLMTFGLLLMNRSVSDIYIYIYMYICILFTEFRTRTQ